MNPHHETQQHREPDGHLVEILKSLIDRNNRAQTNPSHRAATNAQLSQANGGGFASLLRTQPVIFQNSSSYPSPFMGISPSYSYPQYSISPREQAAATLLMNEQLLKKRQQQAAEAEQAQRILLATSSTLLVLPSPHHGYAGLPIESLIQSSLSQAFQEGLRAANDGNVASAQNDVRSSVSLMASPTSGLMGSLDKKKEPPDNKIIPEEHLIRLRFPEKLFYMLKQEEHDSAHIISFVGNGTAIKIHDPRLFETDILPRYFDGTRITSFQRQLNLYGFRRIDMGPCRGAYFHKYFVQGQEDNLFKIVRDYKGRTSGGGASATSNAAKKEKLPKTSTTTEGELISPSTRLDAEGKVPSTSKSQPVAKRSSPLEL